MLHALAHIAAAALTVFVKKETSILDKRRFDSTLFDSWYAYQYAYQYAYMCSTACERGEGGRQRSHRLVLLSPCPPLNVNAYLYIHVHVLYCSLPCTCMYILYMYIATCTCMYHNQDLTR